MGIQANGDLISPQSARTKDNHCGNCDPGFCGSPNNDYTYLFSNSIRVAHSSSPTSKNMGDLSRDDCQAFCDASPSCVGVEVNGCGEDSAPNGQCGGMCKLFYGSGDITRAFGDSTGNLQAYRKVRDPLEACAACGGSCANPSAYKLSHLRPLIS